MKALVLPTNRPDRLENFFSEWKDEGGWDHVILIEDAIHKSEEALKARAKAHLLKNNCSHYSWEEIHEILGKDSWIISKQDSAIRCFGFVAAYHLGAEYVLTLDDDCYPIPGGYKESLFDAHVNIIEETPMWVESCLGQRTRGLPYHQLGHLDNVVCNMGLWCGDGDWDSVQDYPEGYYDPPAGSRVIPRGQLVPLCGMNLCIRREALPFFYFPLQGHHQPYRRFDDIWAGVIAKPLLDGMNWHMSVGEPWIEHRRASHPEENRIKEAPGIKANETFWQLWYRYCAGLPTTFNNEPEMVQLVSYVETLKKATTIWSQLFTKDLRFKL